MKHCYSISHALLIVLLLLTQGLMAQTTDAKSKAIKEVDSLSILGISYQLKNDYPKAESHFFKAISICKKQRLKQQLGNSLYNLSALYALTANYEEAINLGKESIDILRRFNDTETLARSLINLEYCFENHGRFIEALEYAKEAISVLRTIEHDALLKLALWRCGELYKQMNTLLAIPMFKESLALAQKIGDFKSLNVIYSSLGDCYNASPVYGGDRNTALSEYYYLKALRSAERYDQNSVNDCRIMYSKICTINKKYREAEHHLKIVYAEAGESNNIGKLSVATFCLSELYFEMKAYAKAYEYLQKHEHFEDVYFRERQKSTVENMAFNFKTDRIKAKNKLLQQEQKLQKIKLEQQSYRNNVKIGIGIALSLFFLFTTLLLYNYFKKKNLLLSQKSDVLRQQLLLTQMSPHFIAESINNIQSLILEEKPKTAVSYLSRFAKLTRQILENSTAQFITVEEELEMAANYLSVQQLLFKEGFTFEIVCDDSIDSESILIPPMLTQPLLATAVQRVVASSNLKGEIIIKFRIRGEVLIVEVKDNGAPLKPLEKRTILESAAVKITIDRLIGTNQTDRSPVKIADIVKGASITGVMAWFEVPYVEDK